LGKRFSRSSRRTVCASIFRLVDSRHHAPEGSPPHPLRFYHVFARAKSQSGR
jgi:hypothetical protein